MSAERRASEFLTGTERLTQLYNRMLGRPNSRDMANELFDILASGEIRNRRPESETREPDGWVSKMDARYLTAEHDLVRSVVLCSRREAPGDAPVWIGTPPREGTPHDTAWMAKKIRKAVDAELERGGQRAGMPKVVMDAGFLANLANLLDRSTLYTPAPPREGDE